MLNKIWRFRPIDDAAAVGLSVELEIPQAVGRLLVGRGIADRAAAERFLQPDLGRLHDPSLLPDIEPAARRIARAVAEHEPILVHGDYDVDGVCSAALLTRGLKALGGNIAVHVPDRHHDGYDLQNASVDEAERNGIGLIVTTDCGIQAVEAVERARAAGIDVVITDHHEPGPELPPAAAVVDPRRDGSGYPFPAICGTGVAFKVLQAVARERGKPEGGLCRAFLDLVAIGTIADMMPLVDENREMVRFGLEYLAQTRKPGLKALLLRALNGRSEIRAEDVAFQVGPRINAVGRLGNAQIALELLLCPDFGRGQLLAAEMDSLNERRRREQERIFREVVAQVQARALNEASILIVAGEAWPTGLLGPVASRLVETYRKPAILIAHDGQWGRGSARTAGRFRMMDALEACRDLMGRCGGHQGAAGFDLEVDNLVAFQERMARIAAESLTPEDLEDRLEIDAALPPSEIGLPLCREIAALEPFGQGHPTPLFASRLMVLDRRTMGPSGSHLKLVVRGDGLDPTEVVFWKQGGEIGRFAPGEEILLAYRLGINRYGGRESAQLEGIDVKAPGDLPLPLPAATADPFAVHRGTDHTLD